MYLHQNKQSTILQPAHLSFTRQFISLQALNLLVVPTKPSLPVKLGLNLRCCFLQTYCKISLYTNLPEIRQFLSYFCIFLSLYQMTPLHLAAQRGRYNLVRYLVDKDADVNIQDINGVRLILCAVCSHATERGCISDYAL